MTLRTHLFYSFFIHTIVLFYLVTLPVYKGSINLKSYASYFVYLKSEEAVNTVEFNSEALKKKMDFQKQNEEKDIQSVEETAKVNDQETTSLLEEEKKNKPPEEKPAQAVEPQEPLKTPDIEKPFKEEFIPAKKEEMAKLEVPEPEVKPKPDSKIPDVAKLSTKEQPPATMKESQELKESLKDTEEGFFLKTISGNPMIPFEKVARSETSLVKKEPQKEKVIASKGDIEKSSREIKKPSEPPVVKEPKKEQPPAFPIPEKIVQTDLKTIPHKNHPDVIASIKEKAPVLEKSSSYADKSLSLDDFSFNMMEPFDEIFKRETLSEGKENKIVLKTQPLPERKISQKIVEQDRPIKIAEHDKTLREKSIANKVKETELAKKETRIKEPLTKISDIKESHSTEKLQETVKTETEIPALPSTVLPKTDAGPILKSSSDKMIMPYGLKKEEKVEEMQKIPSLTTPKEKIVSEKTKEVDISTGQPSRLETKEPSPVMELKNTNTEKLPEVKEKDREIITKVTPIPEEQGEIKKANKEGKGSVAEILTPEKNKMPSREEYLQNLDEKNKQITPEAKPEPREEAISKEEKIPLGIPVPDVLLSKELKIEVVLDNAETPDVSFNLLSNTHPMDKKRNEPGKYNKIDINEERKEINIEGFVRIEKVFSIAKAERKTYIFEISNKGRNAYEADISFRFFEGKNGERIKEYKTVKILPNLTIRYKFILPEAVFWDDEYYFTGKIESPNSITKFNDKTGLIWKENRDY